MIREARNALAFLSRLVLPPSMNDDGTELADAVPFYPLAGAALGCLAACPVLFAPDLAAWLYPLILAWLTRGLHWDGLVDLADACGSNATGDKFWKIIRDSRIGAFGGMALVFAIAGQIISAQGCIADGNLYALILAPAYGRAMVITLGRLSRPHPASSLAALIHPGTRSIRALFALGLTVILAIVVLGITSACIAFALTAVCLVCIVRIAARHGGTNGDFYGTMIVTTEICVLVAGGI